MKTFTVHVRSSYHHRFPITVRASDIRHAKRKALRRAGLVPVNWHEVEQDSPEVMYVDGSDAGEEEDGEDGEPSDVARRACLLMLKAAMRGDELQTGYALDLAAEAVGRRAYLALRRECGLPECDECGTPCACEAH